jgi:hypothetical protein
MVLGSQSGDSLSTLLAEEWVSHLFGDRAGLEAVDTAGLDDLQALITDDAAPGNTGPAEVVLVLGDLRTSVA